MISCSEDRYNKKNNKQIGLNELLFSRTEKENKKKKLFSLLNTQNSKLGETCGGTQYFFKVFGRV
jgi:hypothetical protein